MPRTALPVAAALLLGGALLATPSTAQDQTLIFRFGIALVEPTSDTDADRGRFEFDTRGGVGVNFEWMFHPRVGLEASNDLIGDIDVELDGDYVAGTTFSTLVVGLNFHPVRTERIDWGVGAFAGATFFSDWKGFDGDFDFDSTSDSAWGAQTFVDISVSRRWAVDLGVKYYDASVDLRRFGNVDYNPIILRTMGVVRW